MLFVTDTKPGYAEVIRDHPQIVPPYVMNLKHIHFSFLLDIDILFRTAILSYVIASPPIKKFSKYVCILLNFILRDVKLSESLHD
jgi:hypothetical protein